MEVHHPGARVGGNEADVDLLARVDQHGVAKERLVDRRTLRASRRKNMPCVWIG
jgi:hypothetical protein